MPSMTDILNFFRYLQMSPLEMQNELQYTEQKQYKQKGMDALAKAQEDMKSRRSAISDLSAIQESAHKTGVPMDASAQQYVQELQQQANKPVGDITSGLLQYSDLPPIKTAIASLYDEDTQQQSSQKALMEQQNLAERIIKAKTAASELWKSLSDEEHKNPAYKSLKALIDMEDVEGLSKILTGDISGMGKMQEEYKQKGMLSAQEAQQSSVLEAQKSVNKLNEPVNQGENFRWEQQLRGQFDTMSKNFLDVRDSYNRIKIATKNPSPASDLALLYNYMKMLDPASVVRESEFAVAAKTGTFGDKMQSAVNQIANGKRLSDKQRNDFLKSSQELYLAQKNLHDQLKSKYNEIAEGYRLNPERVTGGFSMDSVDVVPLGQQKTASQGWTSEKESRYQELLKKKQQGTLQ